jgi:hypothetical protein
MEKIPDPRDMTPDEFREVRDLIWRRLRESRHGREIG